MIFYPIKWDWKDNGAELFSNHKIYLFGEGEENNLICKTEELN